MKRIAIMGTGQLAQMMALASSELETSFVFVAQPGDDTTCVEGLGEVVLYDPSWQPQAFYQAMGEPDVVTVEKEAISVSLLESLQDYCLVAPGARAIGITQNRSDEKSFLKEQGIPCVGFASASNDREVRKVMEAMPLPVIIKSAESGYDGKYQWRINSAEALEQFMEGFRRSPVPVVVEQWVDFTAEVSMLAARSVSGELIFYPLTQNEHKNGILLTSRAPVSPQLRAYEPTAKKYLEKLVSVLDYVGVLAMECFVVDGQLLVNELAPRVHNSGHWTQNGCQVSQFENHIRAISGHPLVEPVMAGEVGMLNLLGLPKTKVKTDQPGCTLHWYGKACKPGRKMGHINICQDKAVDVDRLLKALEQRLYAQ